MLKKLVAVVAAGLTLAMVLFFTGRATASDELRASGRLPSGIERVITAE